MGFMHFSAIQRLEKQGQYNLNRYSDHCRPI